MKQFLLGIFVTVVIVLCGVGVLFVGGPKNLGITATPEQSKAAREKVGTATVSLPKETASSDDFRLEGRRPADFTMDSVELTAHSNNRPWKQYPLRSVQIRIHDDGSIEASAMLQIAKAIPYAMALGYSREEIQSAMTRYQIPPFEVPLYIRGTGSVQNDVPSVNATSVVLGRVPIPQGIVSQANREAERVIADVIKKHASAFHAESLTFSNGKMHFVGSVAQTEYVVTE